MRSTSSVGFQSWRLSGARPGRPYVPTSETNTSTNTSQIPIAATTLVIALVIALPSSDRGREPAAPRQVNDEQHHADEEEYPGDLGGDSRDAVHSQEPRHEPHDQEREGQRYHPP